MSAEEAQTEQEEEEDTFVMVANSEVMHEGNKLYWKINRTVDFRVYFCEEAGAIVVRGFDSKDNVEFPPILLDLNGVAQEVAKADVSQDELSKQMNGAAYKKPEAEVQVAQEDPNMRKRRLKAEAEQRRASALMSEEEVAAARQAVLEEEQRARDKAKDEWKQKLVSFIIARLEGIKGKDEHEGSILFELVKRGSDAYGSLELDPAACMTYEEVKMVGHDAKWNKKEDMDEVRKNRQSISEGLKQSGDAMKASSDRLAAIQMAMDAVKNLNNKELFNKLPRHRQIFVAVVKKAMFQGRVEGIKLGLEESPTYAELLKEQAEKQAAAVEN